MIHYISQSWGQLRDMEFISRNNVFVGCDKTSHHQTLTEADFQKIDHSQALNSNPPEGTVSKVWSDVQPHPGRRAREGNCQLKPESFIIH